MSIYTRLFTVLMITSTFICGSEATAAMIDLDDLGWELSYLIDQSESIGGDSQFFRPRDNRGLALSPNGDFLYAGYNNGIRGDCCEVRRLNVSQLNAANDDYITPVVNRLKGVRGKQIAVDDVGRVYLAEGDSVQIYSADLQTNLGSLGGLTNKTEGVAVTREGSQLVMYTTSRGTLAMPTGGLSKWFVNEAGLPITITPDNSFDSSDPLTNSRPITGNLRGVSVAPDGTVWVSAFGTDLPIGPGAQPTNGRVYRFTSDGNLFRFQNVAQPMDIDFVTDPDGDNIALVSNWATLEISRWVFDDFTIPRTIRFFPDPDGVIDPITGNSILTVPWTFVDLPASLDPIGLDSIGAFAGLAVTPDGTSFFLANEDGQTLDLGDGTDDNEPIFYAYDNGVGGLPLFNSQGGAAVQNPEPSTMLMAVWALSLLGVGGWRRSAR